MGGRIVPTPIATFRKVVEQVLPIFKAKGQNAAIIVPPLARYVFSRCCNDDEKDFPEKLLSGLIQQRSELIKGLVQNGITNFKVLDVGCVTDGATTANISEKLTDLKRSPPVTECISHPLVTKTCQGGQLTVSKP